MFNMVKLILISLVALSCRKNHPTHFQDYQNSMVIAVGISDKIKEDVKIPENQDELFALCKLIRDKSISEKIINEFDKGNIFFVKSSGGKMMLIKGNGYNSYKNSFIFIQDTGYLLPVYLANNKLDNK